LKITNHYRNSGLILILSLLLGGCAASTVIEPPDPLASWNEGSSKQSIMEFVSDVTNPDSDHYVKPAERIAVFDNDGTLWATALNLRSHSRHGPGSPGVADNATVSGCSGTRL
jgi:hypothetical protein